MLAEAYSIRRERVFQHAKDWITAKRLRARLAGHPDEWRGPDKTKMNALLREMVERGELDVRLQEHPRPHREYRVAKAYTVKDAWRRP